MISKLETFVKYKFSFILLLLIIFVVCYTISYPLIMETAWIYGIYGDGAGISPFMIFVLILNCFFLIAFISTIVLILRSRNRNNTYKIEKLNLERKHKVDLLDRENKIQQQTMVYLGQEIHDSVAQKLTLASIYSQKLEHELINTRINESLRSINIIINESLDELRHLTYALFDDRFQKMNFRELLEVECERINTAGVCRCMIKGEFDKELGINVKMSLLRVLQEFSQNSLKHSKCKLINITIAESNGGLSIIAADVSSPYFRTTLN